MRKYKDAIQHENYKRKLIANRFTNFKEFVCIVWLVFFSFRTKKNLLKKKNLSKYLVLY